ncbi:uncharacterized protein [Halyomorpha halys]|uniref:uncharacterized protein n=1 Tax=Halyomorpha halys TaxID=286706 RepID=UPI0006D4EB0B|nr:uncharacterized protein LOC106692583 [Halyomorpha halys]XP_014294109.1 uncharacterized protein LOC106692583 [Halyomorpha halys]
MANLLLSSIAIKHNNISKRKNFSKEKEKQTPKFSIVEVLSDSDEEHSISPLKSTDKEQSPDSTTTPKQSILAPTTRKRRHSSGKRKLKKFPCAVCNVKFVTEGNLDLHMKAHWNVYEKMEELLRNITNKTTDKEEINQECKCSRCIYESRGKQKPYEILKNFSCYVCSSSFVSANKLSTHMDKHRDIYFKMKTLEGQNHIMFHEHPSQMITKIILSVKVQCEASIPVNIQNPDKHHWESPISSTII